MKTLVISMIAILLGGGLVPAQPIPADSLYLGQVPPGNTPRVFKLAVASGSFAAERIAISDDNREIYYSVIKKYYPTSGDTLKRYRFAGGHWTGPENLFDNYQSPALSRSGDTLFFQNNSDVYETYCSVRTDTTWGEPTRVLPDLNSVHYLQETSNGHLYVSSIPAAGLGGNDWCRLDRQQTDTTAVSLGLPVSSTGDNLDFFIARDESFMILSKSGLRISYRKTDGGWTNPKSLGPQINFGMNMWGPFVSADNHYLFYTTGTKPDYSDVHVYWVRADHLIDSLKHTNFIPYLKNAIPRQNAYVGRAFQYTVADSIIVDDDGNNTLRYSATLSNTGALPGWLAFDTVTAMFSGIPPEPQELKVRLTATDPTGAFVRNTFEIYVGDTTSIDTQKNQGFRTYPNPTRGKLHVLPDIPEGKPVVFQVTDMKGTLLLHTRLSGEGLLDLSDLPKGIYLLAKYDNRNRVVRRVFIY